MGSEDVYITGIDMIKFGKFPDRSVASLGAESALLALDDAGNTINDVGTTVVFELFAILK